ncbi:MAG: D-mannonate oxidoreductase [Candidatus Dactylopiibacterium carminicum]|uniref:D-mannonate oxidoreductase n=1 Tax=Candidatus Dactylopiibacterium carminicum TaxID=857335 RepID=A0A272EWC4_9RHOO|nr:SDR family oxidoreductase [Candidatus Dactylopiibacterium carminicum]KAF7599570.1 D-mannonate oxidoreductase [Candidatus Dactylopiibacterium carminicum]PAS94412.1 MAG: D-mannonate oxidoreductase [Candidatus Dactylopiibacterium carminicum]PAS96425.1 MAG: D-mannonate oxidoreductase [Candidatus Dactylopiibacterium carminicum]PAS99573.1 MAG: D-mannonate oxidoreductase [Candidatus Dactylopiibacterium carminicum]
MLQTYKVDLGGKVAVVTGGGGVLCAEIARALAHCGARVAILDLKQEAAEAVAAQIRTAGFEAIGLAANVLDRASLEGAAAEVEKQLGPCDLLINGAGGNHPKGTTSRETFSPADLQETDPDVTTFFTLDPEGMRFVFDLNFLGTLLPSQVFARQMVGREGCGILNISSMNAFRPLTKIPAYSAAKAAVSNFTQWLAVHLAPAGIRVNAIAPGFFVTHQNHALLFSPTGEPTARAGKILRNTPMNRFGEASELTGTLLWLASTEASGFVTGVVVPVDGGFSAYSGV